MINEKETKDEVREALIEIARTVFGKYGFKKTTVDDIAEAAGKGKSSLYYYFKSKDEIFLAVIKREIELVKEKIKERIEGIEDPIDKIKTYIKSRMHDLKELVNIYSVVGSDFKANFQYLEQIRNEIDKEENELIKGFLKEGISKGIFREIDNNIDLSAKICVAALKGLEIFVVDNQEEISEEQYDTIMDIVFFGLIKR